MNLIKKVFGREKAPEHQVLYVQGLFELAFSKDPTAAIEKFKAAVKLKPNYLDAQVSLGQAYLTTKQYDLAVTPFQAAVAISPKNSDAHLGLAEAYVAQGKFDDFFREGELTFRLSGQPAEVFTDLAAGAGEAQTRQEKLAVAALCLALLYYNRQSWAKLQDACEALLEMDADLQTAHYMLGIAHFHQGRLDEAQVELRQAAELGSEEAAKHPLLGICDLCSAPLQAGTKQYSAADFKSAVRSGLRPPATAIELGAAFGMSQSQTEANWINRVMADSTDWFLCSSCYSASARFLPSK
jgi:Tfp pilus assembly protein PilF